MKIKLTSMAIALAVVTFFAACTKDDATPPTAKQDGNKILSSTRWTTTMVLDSVKKDVTAANMAYVGLADYLPSGDYVFFNMDGTPRGDEGYFFITPDNSKRILVSRTRNYTRVVDVVTLTPTEFTYRVVNAAGAKVDVVHKPINK